MAKEPVSNIGFLCREHSSKPVPTDMPLQELVGKFVKKAFAVTHAGCESREHMWVKVTGVEGDCLVGILDNDPVCVTPLRCGDQVRVERAEIEDITVVG